ncbi:bifunctional 4-hydroxy-2-oxoglutarate aldolase/2-dehydro-3-deoxy-phosphogluconate aldolase [Pseudovibrio exalbescens]|uniref:bifunctional 4-hydroxy-2-oxoglutarate aldolase/2-dehydro-3-deoxy-phosphogluconate aldolase n=1 Tax=Pseudovibrio exalbescens TaxID=197461 RepID=UPI002366181C|nr:bifunctional 4-hydroxy-2-oxoglutarate aldolase/2-dehydro-3-deoxy-phosphogluconate aldolase [Pseudovibrio exalbescens]MDD7910386.1 bifunctional 4-hydroxy-2-oxoglutarate aldolase/2-dehydro-3-deoxy-phosphogluconate aldolase [Pseudovibrio exalbescens]
MSQNIERVEAVMTAAPVIPVLVVNDPKKAVGMARALVKGGLPSIEITLRTPNALDCIKAVAEEVEGAMVGAGTVLEHAQYEAAVKAGSTFVVSPGFTKNLLDAASNFDVPLLPGVSTVSEVMTLLEAGYQRLKFFPAVPAGGAPFLKSMSSPLPQAKFCPTGGIGLATAPDFLKLPNILCVGGSWIADAASIEAEDWDGIETRAREAASL